MQKNDFFKVIILETLAFVIINTMLMSISERKEETGMRTSHFRGSISEVYRQTDIGNESRLYENKV